MWFILFFFFLAPMTVQRLCHCVRGVHILSYLILLLLIRGPNGATTLINYPLKSISKLSTSPITRANICLYITQPLSNIVRFN
jgi:hypothetical protein